MIITIANALLRVSIKTKGAELSGIHNQQTNLEYMWGGDPAFWGKTSPVLFPVVGALKQDTFLYQGKPYHLPRHGFAREQEFVLEEHTPERVSLVLRSNAETLMKYPFPFALRIIYQLDQASLAVSYEVVNTGKETMYFSLGAHPAFRVPLTTASTYDEYYLEFNRTEHAPRWRITADGLIQGESQPLLGDTNRLPLAKALFYQDALVFKKLNSDCISLRSANHKHGLDFSFEGFPYFGIWAAKDADFVCLEPWCGIADGVGHNQVLEQKEGIEQLPEGQVWTRTWKVKCY